MSMFEDRAKGFEAKYQHDQELQFKVMARRNRLLGRWAAVQLGLEGEATDVYAKTVVLADFERPGDDDVLQKVLKDLTAKGVAVSAATVRAEKDRLLVVARDQVMKKG